MRGLKAPTLPSNTVVEEHPGNTRCNLRIVSDRLVIVLCAAALSLQFSLLSRNLTLSLHYKYISHTKTTRPTSRLLTGLMTQLFHSAPNNSGMPSEKRHFTGIPLSNKQVNNSNTQVSQKIKNFFRINSSNDTKDAKDGRQSDSAQTTRPEKQSTFRQSRFLPHISRNRTNTTASEGNALDEGLSPTAHANPYFIHQGPPAIRHHNEGSVPPSPPDTPKTISALAAKANAVNGSPNDQATTAPKEELARKLRRVASAPNAQGFFTSGKDPERPSTAELGKEPLVQHANSSTLSMVETAPANQLTVPPINGLTIPAPRDSLAFRRTYSSNSIKVRNVEVGPGSFDKIKLIGKGDVGKVYLVREKKSSRLYAMKGESGMNR